jgi:AraC family transcriptional regulator, transcriptional activator of pobA
LHSVLKFERLYGEHSTERNAVYVFSELLETRSSKFGWKIKLHFHPGLYQIFFIEKGKLTFYEVKNQTQLEGPCIIYIPPTILHGFDFDNSTKGIIISLDDSIASKIINNLRFSTPFYEYIQVINQFNENIKSIRVKSVMEFIDEELFKNLSLKSLMLQSKLQELFILVYRLSQKCRNSIPEGSDQISFTYFRKFKQLILNTDNVGTLGQIADKIGISTVHLNRICNQISGKSAGKIIHEHILENAQRYLLHTSYSVSEISYILNFEYPNYFARFFKKHTGLTPKEFRHNINMDNSGE